MTVKIKRLLLTAVIAVFLTMVCCLSFGAVKKTAVKADAVEEKFAMCYSTQLKLNGDGMAFKVQMNYPVWLKLQDSANSLYFIIMPEKFFDKIDSTPELAAIGYSAAIVRDEDGNFDANASHCLYIRAEKSVGYAGGYYYCYAGVKDIDLKYKTLNYGAIAVIEMKDGNNYTYEYADHADGIPATSIYNTATSALYNGGAEDVEALTQESYNWYGTASLPVYIDDAATYAKVQGRLEDYEEYITGLNYRIADDVGEVEDLGENIKTTYTVSISANNDDYGTVNKTSVKRVLEGDTITSDGNTVSVNGTTITATVADPTSKYVYEFDSWTNGSTTVSGSMDVVANFNRLNFNVSQPVLSKYESNKRIEIPDATIGTYDCDIQVVNPDATTASLDGNVLTLSQTGDYTVKYTSKTNADLFNSITFNSVASVASVPYITSSDGAATYGTSGNLATITGWKKDTVLTVNKVADVSGASFSGNYLICQPNFYASSIGANFGSFVIKLTDYKDADNYLTITIYEIEDKRVNARVQVNGEDYTAISYVYYEGAINVIFDYAEKKVALADKAYYVTINGFSGFTDGKCIITMYAEDWKVNSTDIAFDWITDNHTYETNLSEMYMYNLEFYDDNDTLLESKYVNYGVMADYSGSEPSKTSGKGVYYTFGWDNALSAVTADATYTAEFTPVYVSLATDRPLIDNYQTGHTIELPDATLGGKTCSPTVSFGGDSVAITNGKLYFANAGAYTIKYCADDDTDLYDEITVNACASLNVISSTDGAATCTVNGNFHNVSGWNKDTKLTFNKVIDLNSVGNKILLAPIIAQGFSTSTFDYLSIKITDYKDSDNVIEIRMLDNPDDSTKYHFVVYVNGVKKGEADANNKTSQCNIWIKYMETAGNKFNPIQLWFGGIANTDAHRDLTGFEGFTDNKAIITVEAVGWKDDIDSASIGFDWLMSSRTYTTDLTDLYCDEN